jgi:hypothetical protein
MNSEDIYQLVFVRNAWRLRVRVHSRHLLRKSSQISWLCGYYWSGKGRKGGGWVHFCA